MKYYHSAIIGMIILAAVIISIPVISLYLIGNEGSNEVANFIEGVTLEKTSCEEMFRIKINLSNYDIAFFDEDKIVKQITKKWDSMDCSNPNSQYWRGVSWEYTDTIEDKIDMFEN